MALFARICVLRGFPAAAYREYASPNTLVRPRSEQKLLIYELETHRAHFIIVDGHYLMRTAQNQSCGVQVMDPTLFGVGS